MNFIAHALVSLLAHSVDIEGLAAAMEAVFNDIAHGEGGLEKIQKISQLLPTVAASAEKVAADVAASGDAPTATGA